VCLLFEPCFEPCRTTTPSGEMLNEAMVQGREGYPFSRRKERGQVWSKHSVYSRNSRVESRVGRSHRRPRCAAVTAAGRRLHDTQKREGVNTSARLDNERLTVKTQSTGSAKRRGRGQGRGRREAGQRHADDNWRAQLWGGGVGSDLGSTRFGRWNGALRFCMGAVSEWAGLGLRARHHSTL
jgi:hypothetical protein